jgi:uncharacterized protein YjiS (DUF1127 family)
MSILANILEARRRRQTISDLRAMSPEILLDIGIEPDRIDAVVSEAVRSRRAQRPPQLNAPTFSAPGLSNGAWPYVWRR